MPVEHCLLRCGNCGEPPSRPLFSHAHPSVAEPAISTPVPSVPVLRQRTALGIDDAESLARRRLHYPPPPHESNSPSAELLQPFDFSLEVVGFDVQVNPAGVIHLLQENDRLVALR